MRQFTLCSSRLQRGLTILELMMVIIIIGIIGAVSIVKYVDTSSEGTKNKQAYVDSSMWAKLTAASRSNYQSSVTAASGSRIAKWEYSCLAGYHIIQLLDDRTMAGGYGGFWYKLPNGDPDFDRFWALSGPEDFSNGEMKECTATKDGVAHKFMLTGCTTWECRCNDYPSDCENYP